MQRVKEVNNAPSQLILKIELLALRNLCPALQQV